MNKFNSYFTVSFKKERKTIVMYVHIMRYINLKIAVPIIKLLNEENIDIGNYIENTKLNTESNPFLKVYLKIQTKQD